jgi:subtilisin-like proprotein convertase family protein
MAALVLSGRPGASASLVRRAIMGSGLDIQAPGWDRDTGRGILQPGNALTTARAHAQSYAVAGEAHVVSSTDGDTFAEPGETAVVEIPVTNLGDAGADRVHLRLRSNTVGLRITPATRAYGPIAAGATVTRRYRVAIAASVPLGSTPSLQATVSFSGAFSPQATDTDVVIGQPADQTVGFAYAGPAVAIPDADPTGVSLPVTVSGLGAVSSASFSIDGSACATTDGSAGVGLDHSFVGDLVGTLTAPDGTTVKLFDRFGGEGDNICQMRLIDTAARSIETATAEEAPFVGEWLPAEPLAALRGTQGDGIWHFTVADQAAADEGSIRAFTLSLAGYVQSQS